MYFTVIYHICFLLILNLYIYDAFDYYAHVNGTDFFKVYNRVDHSLFFNVFKCYGFRESLLSYNIIQRCQQILCLYKNEKQYRHRTYLQFNFKINLNIFQFTNCNILFLFLISLKSHAKNLINIQRIAYFLHPCIPEEHYYLTNNVISIVFVYFFK